MFLPISLLLLSGLLLTDRRVRGSQTRTMCSSTSAALQDRKIKIDITAAGQFSTNSASLTRYKEGAAIDGVVWMTNMGDAPVCVCSSAPLYQDKPQLFKDGKEIPYFQDQRAWVEEYWNSDEPCMVVTRPFEFYRLEPHLRTRVDWFVISEGKQKSGNIKWYDTLGVGHYQLSLIRKFDCCTGPEAKSQPLNFEIIEDDFIFSESVNRMSRLTTNARKAFDLAWDALTRDPDIPEKELAAYNVELIDQDDAYFFYFHSRQRERFFAERGYGNSSPGEKGAAIGRDSGYWVRKSDYTIPMSVR